MRRRDFLGLAGVATLGAVRPTLLTSGPASPVHAAADQEVARDRVIARLIEAKMAEHRIPGVAFGVLKDDELGLHGFGLTNLDNPQPVTPDTVFPIASISKTVVATAMMRLVEEGRVYLEAPVREYLPDFRVRSEAASRDVRIWHLLTHTPGWEGQLGTPDRGPETLASFVEGLGDLPQLATPGTVWSYNNAGFGVAGLVLEVLTEGTIGEALRELVFEPVGLTHAFTRTGTAMTHRFAAPHREAEGRTTVVRPFRLPANVAAGGAAMSLASIMAYARFHLGDGTAHGTRVLQRETLEQMRTPRLTKNSTTDEIGLAWQLRTVGGVRTAAHGGTLSGHCLHLQLVPERRLAFAILTNHRQGWRLIQAVERAVLDTYEGLALEPGQATGGNRGGNEDMTVHAQPLATQPPPDAYIGTYSRPPNGTAEVMASEIGLVIRGGGAGGEGVPLVFWGPDLTYAAPADGTGYPYYGMPIEFVRRPDGSVGWVRINGRIAARDLG
jgi:CubicO group peptidase (beta-lactamase class C family)